MLVKTFCAEVAGLEATTITIEVNITRGVQFRLSGLADTAVKESYDRIRAAIANNGYKPPTADLTVNLSPADIRKEGSGYDLPLAIGILAAHGKISDTMLGDYMMIGELGLDGRLKPVNGVLPVAIRARKEKFKGLIVPCENVREAAVVNQLDVYGMDGLADVISFLNGSSNYEPTIVDTRKEFYEQQYDFDLDFADVKGQEGVKRALEIAAAGSHNIIMIGSPGSGKSMMAKRLPSILPPLTLAESLETTQIHSVAGKLSSGTSLISQRPFRSPHHTVSQVAMTGGGNRALPGEVSMAHNGVLFLDELPEFNKTTLEVLRQPLEDRKITISRAKYTVEYPCSFMFVASMKPGESSSAIRERVIKARQIQQHRYKDYKGIYCNAQMTERMIHLFAEPDERSLDMLRTAMERLSLSARAYSRILKVARTIADLEGSEKIQSHHIAEAIGYRNLDRGDWAER